MKKIAILALSCALVGLSGCGKKLSPLTEEQKRQLAETLDSAQRAQKAVPRQGAGISSEMRPVESQLRAKVKALSLVAPARAETSSTLPHDRSEDEMRGRLSRGAETHSCNIDVKYPNSGSSNGSTPVEIPQDLALKIKVSGESCPISMNFDIDMQFTQTSARIGIDCDYTVRDRDYLGLNDVDQLTLKGDIKMTGNSQGTEVEADAKIEGKLHSQRHGDVKLEMKGGFEGSARGQAMEGEGEMVLRFEFQDFVAELKQTFENDKVTHYINDEEVTEQEFNSFFDRTFGQGNGAGGGNSGGGSGGGNSSSYSYQFVENGCDTGKHQFPSLAEYCNALKDNSLNNGCAYRMRMETYKQKCGQVRS